MDRKFFYILVVLIVVGVSILMFSYYSNNKQELLINNFSQYSNIDSKTTQSPEQTHKKLIENLKTGNFTDAVSCCFFVDDFKKRKEFFKSIEQRGMLEMMISDLSMIKKENTTDSVATYSYLGSKVKNKVVNLIIFVKDNEGVWRIKFL